MVKMPLTFSPFNYQLSKSQLTAKSQLFLQAIVVHSMFNIPNTLNIQYSEYDINEDMGQK